jgi:tetratricopeptide (TPR) repeat protein
MSLTDYFNLNCDFEKALKNINFVIENVNNYYSKKTKKPSPLSIMAPIYNAKNFSITMINNNSIPLSEIKTYTSDLEKSLNSKEHRFVNFSRIILGRNLTKTNPIAGIYELQNAIMNLEKWFKGSSVNKEQAFAHSSIGLIYIEINEIDKAIEHFKESISISKQIFTNLSNSYVNEAFSGLVSCYLKKGMVYEAQEAYNTHKKIFIDNQKSSITLFKKIIEHYNQMEKT